MGQMELGQMDLHTDVTQCEFCRAHRYADADLPPHPRLMRADRATPGEAEDGSSHFICVRCSTRWVRPTNPRFPVGWMMYH